MVFSSAIFLFYFFPAFLLLYFLTPSAYKNLTALLGSLFFYAWGAPLFLFVLLGSVTLDFFLVQALHRHPDPLWRKRLLWLALGLNFGLLAYFKYANFFVENVNELLGAMGLSPISWLAVALPIGISFFTFQKISYIVDVYRGTHAPLRRLHDFALYIILFPQLIAGPIVRFHEIADQIEDRRGEVNVDNALQGMFRFLIGLSKKMLIANPLGKWVDPVFAAPFEELATVTAWVMIIAYALQIYFDFSGYSDMAIGIGRMLGFRFPENFNHPYISRSITEFWQRWHMTLSRWMRDYLYIPLGGNRVSKGRLYFNLSLVFLLSGLWHGAAWSFVAWGAFHGLFLVLERLFLGEWLRRAGRLPAIIFTGFITLLGWVLFRAATLGEAVRYLEVLFVPQEGLFRLPFSFWFVFWLGLAICLLPTIPHLDERLNRIYEGKLSYAGLLAKTLVSALLIYCCFFEVMTTDFNPFIYFRF